MQNAVAVTVWRPICPHCGKDSHVSLEGRFNSQPKDDAMYGCECRACHKNFDVVWSHEKQELTLPPRTTNNAIPILILVSLETFDRQARKRLYLVVKSDRYGDPDAVINHQEEWEHRRYFYEEHTCPTNFVRVKQFLIDGDDDPHGIFEFHDFADMKDVVWADKPGGDVDTKATWPHVFQGQIINGDVHEVVAATQIKG